MMLKLSLAAIIATAIALPAEEVDPSLRIAGGTPAAPGNFSFIVSISIRGQHTCGGSLLNSDTVLTAAHCVHMDHPLDSWKVRAGSPDCKTGGTVVGVRSMTPHSSHNKQYENDIAIFKLAQPIPEGPSISYAKLPQQSADPPAQAHASLVGWGAQRDAGPGEDVYPSKLQTAGASIMDRNACSQQVPQVTDGMICVDSSAGRAMKRRGPGASRQPGLFDWNGVAPPQDMGDWSGGPGAPSFPGQAEARGLCSGDSGGPIVVNGEVAGVVSFLLTAEPQGSKCQKANQPAVGTRVGKYVDSFIKRFQDDKTPGGQPQLPAGEGETPQDPQSQQPPSQQPPSQGSQSCPPGCISLDSLFNQPQNMDWSGAQ